MQEWIINMIHYKNDRLRKDDDSCEVASISTRVRHNQRCSLVWISITCRPLFQRCNISLVLAFAVEVSQLYHSPWIDGIRSTTLGGLVLGFGFLWSDLVCYLVGIAAGALAELTIRRWRKMRETNSAG